MPASTIYSFESSCVEMQRAMNLDSENRLPAKNLPLNALTNLGTHSIPLPPGKKVKPGKFS